MATDVKCVLSFNDSSGTGWQEVHIWNTSSEAPALDLRLANLVDVVCPARAALLSGDCQLIGARVSYKRTKAVASLSKRVYMPGVADVVGVSSAISLAFKWADGSRTKHKVTHIRGFWDVVEFNGEYHPEGGASLNWNDRVNNFKSILVEGGYGWLSKDPAKSSEGSVEGYTVLPSGHITFQLGGELIPLAMVGKTVTVRFSRLNNGSSPLNQAFLVYVNEQDSVTTVDQVAAGPFTARGRYNYRDTSFVRYGSLYDISTGRRAQGRPIGQLPGRQKAKPRY